VHIPAKNTTSGLAVDAEHLTEVLNRASVKQLPGGVSAWHINGSQIRAKHPPLHEEPVEVRKYLR